eukprot:4291529-Ditylum_brightwellii.AAC.1
MTDNKIQSILVYRIATVPEHKSNGKDDDTVTSISSNSSGSPFVKLLAVYDNTRKEGSSKKEYRHVDTISDILKSNPPLSDCETGKLGDFKIVDSNMYKIVYGLAVVTGLKYPTRISIQMLTELYNPYSEQFGAKFKSSSFKTLNKKSRHLLSSFYDKYEDVANVDKTHDIANKIDKVKETMQENIVQALQNTEHIESLASRADVMHEQAEMFKRKSKVLHKKMKTKNMKTTIILGLVAAGVIVGVSVPFIMKEVNRRKNAQ